jgi:pyruvate,water dikinase
MWEDARAVAGGERQSRLKEWRQQIRALSLPETCLHETHAALRGIPGTSPLTLWAVRSSATHEDDDEATAAGLYTTRLGVPLDGLPEAIRECWASLWSDAACAYHDRLKTATDETGMAVIIQPLLSPVCSGVAYSQHPLTSNPDHVLVNAVPGLAEALVSGRVTPDAYLVHVGRDSEPRVLEAHIAERSTILMPADPGVKELPVTDDRRQQAAVSDEHILALARLTKDVERKLTHPVDVEWAIDEAGIWLLQARSISKSLAKGVLTNGTSAWSRANFKETLPELPSPLGLSFLQDFMQRNIIRHYIDLGCDLPPELSSVRIIEGRPFLNVSLLQLVVAQLAGDPALVAEQVGGRLPQPPRTHRLPWWKLGRAAVLAAIAMRRASKQAAAWFSEMRRMGEDHATDRLKGLQPVELWDRLDRIGQRLAERDLTFAIVSGASQGMHALRWLLARRLRDEWRPVLNASVQGIGTVISARQIFLLAELAGVARADPKTRSYFVNDSWESGRYRTDLAGSAFLEAFDRYLKEYGHRAVGESDVMSPRFAENPDGLLDVIRGHLLRDNPTSIETVHQRQTGARAAAVARIQSSFGWRWHERILFRWWHHDLCRYLALREANRHHLMYFTSAVRRLLLTLGGVLAADGTIASEDDVFFLTIDELRALCNRQGGRDSKANVRARRAERERQAMTTVPDFIGGIPVVKDAAERARGALLGLPISTGYAEGTARLVRSTNDFTRVQAGDILVVSVIDPGLAPLFGLAGGLIAEMGGILSHGAIIAREYGIPAVANVAGIMDLLHDSDRVAVDANAGEIRLLGRAG